MPILAQCSKCRAKFKAQDRLAGKPVKCPQCGATILIPEPELGLAEIPARSVNPAQATPPSVTPAPLNGPSPEAQGAPSDVSSLADLGALSEQQLGRVVVRPKAESTSPPAMPRKSIGEYFRVFAESPESRPPLLAIAALAVAALLVIADLCLIRTLVLSFFGAGGTATALGYWRTESLKGTPREQHWAEFEKNLSLGVVFLMAIPALFVVFRVYRETNGAHEPQDMGRIFGMASGYAIMLGIAFKCFERFGFFRTAVWATIVCGGFLLCIVLAASSAGQ